MKTLLCFAYLFNIGVNRNWDIHTVCIQTRCRTAGRHWKRHCALVKSRWWESHTPLTINREAVWPDAALQGPQISFWELSPICVLLVCLPVRNLAPSELKGLFVSFHEISVEFIVNFCKIVMVILWVWCFLHPLSISGTHCVVFFYQLM